MKPLLKVALVAGGYLLALLAALAAVALHAAFGSEAGGPSSGGMAAFGDLVLFVAVFGALAVVPTGAGLYFLWSKAHRRRPSPETSRGSPGPRI
jgi:hypothetical protein